MLRAVLILLTLLCSANVYAQNHDLHWARGAVWYQIFPERFRNGDTENDPVKARVVGERDWDWQVHPWTSDWYALQPWEQHRNQSFYEVVFDRWYGGDLIGVIGKLDYLKELGVDVIYFNPVFEAPSLHKYDASSYHHIDNNFGPDREGDLTTIEDETEDPASWTFTGADRLFLDLVKAAHGKGIRVVIDGVFNHCGSEFWAFKDVAVNQEKSRYKDWFEVTRWDDPATPDVNEFDYQAYWGFKIHPEFREDENGLVEPVRKYVFDITRRWLDPNGDGDPSDGVDGWRLDAAKDVAPKFWEDWYQLVKSINPEAITVGEIWDEASEWIKRKRFDAVMNYPFAYPVVDFFIDQKTAITVSEFDRKLADLRNGYPSATNHILIDLIDSHDTDRLASMIKNPDLNYDRMRSLRDNLNYDPRKPTVAERRIQKLIVFFQMMYIGAPIIYYGDEAGMWGDDDPDDRKPMVWSDLVYQNETYTSVRPDLTDDDEVQFDKDIFSHYQKLIRIRHANPAIRYGKFVRRLIDDSKGLYGFSRVYKDSEAIIILNNSTSTQTVEFDTHLEPDIEFRDLLNERTYKVRDGIIKLEIANKWAVVLIKK